MNFDGALIHAITQNILLAPFAAMLAGIITSFTPCSITAVPLIIGYIAGNEKNTKKALKLSLTFASGTSIVYTLLGISAAYAGRLMGGSSPLLYIAIGVLMLCMSLQILGIITFIPSQSLIFKRIGCGYTGAFVTGALAGLFSSPCSTPVLIVLLSLAVKDGNMSWGGILLFFYALGHSILVVLTGTSVSLVNKIINDKRYYKFSNFIKYLTAGVVALLSFYMFYLGF